MTATGKNDDDAEGWAREPKRWEGVAAWLFLSSPVFWLVMLALMVGIYIASPACIGQCAGDQGVRAILIGLGGSLVIWALSSLLMSWSMSAGKAQPRLFSELRERRDQLRARLAVLVKVVPADVDSTATPEAISRATAIGEAKGQLEVAQHLLEGRALRPALRWGLGHGYLAVFRAIHRAEEALIVVEPWSSVSGDAVHDDLALRLSSIADKDELRSKLRVAMDAVEPLVGQELLRSSTTRSRPVEQLNELLAREIIREVRHSVNAFRDDARDALVRARQRLIWAMAAMGGASLLLAVLAMLRDVPTSAMTAAAAYYLIGVVVGQFNRVRIESSRVAGVEDYGLYQARLIATIMISGIAAVGGVLLVWGLPSAVNLPKVTSVQLGDIFDLHGNPTGIYIAAIFGLLPGTLTRMLSRQAEQLEGDLQSTRPASSSQSQQTQ